MPQDFVPAGVLDRLVTRANILKVIGEADDTLVQFIEGRAKKTFVITMLYVKLPSNLCLDAIDILRQNDLDDNRLLSQEWSYTDCTEQIHRHEFVAMESKASTHGAAFRTCWNAESVYSFRSNQWKVVVPPALQTQDIGKCVLPITEKQIVSRENTFSTAPRCKLHKDHCKVE